MSIKVMKFGGTSIGSLKRIESITKLILKRLKNGDKKIVIVVSAMGGATDRLIEEYISIDSNLCSPEYDNIISTGEQHSSAIMTTVLKKHNISARSLLGWQIPIQTDKNYGKIERIIQTT